MRNKLGGNYSGPRWEALPPLVPTSLTRAEGSLLTTTPLPYVCDGGSPVFALMKRTCVFFDTFPPAARRNSNPHEEKLGVVARMKLKFGADRHNFLLKFEL